MELWLRTLGSLRHGSLDRQLHCWVGQQHLRDHQGVVGSFLMDLALPTIYLLEYFLPQLTPTERCVDTLDVMAAPMHYSPQPMTFTFLREDVDFVPESVCEGFLLKNLLWYSSANHHRHLIIIIISSSSSSSSHHHLIIIIIIFSSSSHHHHHHLSPLSLSLAFLFFSNLAQPSSHEKRARCNPSQGKCVSSVKN